MNTIPTSLTNLYMLVPSVPLATAEWEDMIIYVTAEDAIEASKKNPTGRVEILHKQESTNGYVPTYNYYKDGALVKTK